MFGDAKASMLFEDTVNSDEPSTFMEPVVERRLKVEEEVGDDLVRFKEVRLILLVTNPTSFNSISATNTFPLPLPID